MKPYSKTRAVVLLLVLFSAGLTIRG
jgi:hypothetical protein